MKTHAPWRAAAAACLLVSVHAVAGERPPHMASPGAGVDPVMQRGLQGLFCNSEADIDATVAQMRKGLSPRVAAELANREKVACTFVDLLRYVVDRPVLVREIPGALPLFKYEGTLVAVLVGGAVREVTPPVRIFFAIPERLRDAPMAGRA